MKTIEDYNRAFKNTLLGTWSSKEGTFFSMYDELTFLEDGTGQCLSESGMSGRLIEKFKWRINAPFVLDMCITDIIVEDDTEEIEEDDADEEPEAERWFSIDYEFKEVQNDVGKTIVLCQKNNPENKFRLFQTRIGYDGVFPTQSHERH